MSKYKMVYCRVFDGCRHTDIDFSLMEEFLLLETRDDAERIKEKVLDRVAELTNKDYADFAWHSYATKIDEFWDGDTLLSRDGVAIHSPKLQVHWINRALYNV